MYSQARSHIKLDRSGGSRYLGVPILKNPCDLWAECMIMEQTRPTVVIETGTYMGGSALYYAHHLEKLGLDSRVISIDLDLSKWQNAHNIYTLPEARNLKYMIGRSSTDPRVLADLRLDPDDRVMVILDSDHRAGHVFEELKAYAPLVTSGCYLVVEDGFVDPNDGPERAIREYFPSRPDWVHEDKWATFFGEDITYNTYGWWRKK